MAEKKRFLKSFNVYVKSEALKERIEKEARENERTESGEISYCLKRYYENKDRREKK